MSSGIEIRLFDGFSILKDGEPILENLSNTRKTKLFVAYLLTNRDRAISHQELFELLWSGEDYSNPATALRTLLYRFRNTLESEGATDLDGAIISRRGAYQWNSDLNINIDALQFQALAKDGMNLHKSLAERKEALEQAIQLYKGSLLPDFCSEPWLISKASMYRDRYVEVVERYIDILKDEKKYSQIVELCDKAVELAGVSELLTLERQMAVLKIAGVSEKSDGDIAKYYEQLKELSQSLQNEADSIQAELEDDMVEQRAYIYDYETFKELYKLERRIQSRTKATIFLALIDVRSGNPQEESSNEIYEDIVECCQRQLRCGDAMCKKSDTEIAILFPAESYEDAMGVVERLKSASKERTNADIIFAYRVKPLKNARE